MMPNRCPVFGELPLPRHFVRHGSPTQRGYGKDWGKVRLMVLARDRQTCQKCGGLATVVDHITPIAKGGARLATFNLQSLCVYCHNRKTATYDM